MGLPLSYTLYNLFLHRLQGMDSKTGTILNFAFCNLCPLTDIKSSRTSQEIYDISTKNMNVQDGNYNNILLLTCG